MRQSTNRGKVGALKQYYNTGNSNFIFNSVQKELRFIRNVPIFDNIGVYLKHIKEYEDKYKTNMEVNLIIIEKMMENN